MAAFNLLAPRYWATWLMVGIFRLIVLLPWRLQTVIGRGIGLLALPLARRRRRITRTNLALCFPELGPASRRRLLIRHFEALGVGALELPAAWWLTDAKLPHPLNIEGLEHLETALHRGRGVLLLTAHFTTLEMGGRLLGTRHPIMFVYRPHKNPLLDRVIRRGRKLRSAGIIERGDLKGLLRALKGGAVVWFAPDQAYLGTRSVYVPFFGIPAPTNTATARIAATSGAPVLPFFVARLSGGAGYRLTIEPPLRDFPSGDPAADASRVNAVLEDGIRRAPSQYLWSHDRFKRFRRP